MRYRELGRSGVRVSEIGFGCWTMGGPNFSSDTGSPIGWAGVNREDILAGVRAGLEAGVNHWDNADVYGNGRAERTLAWCFEQLGVSKGPRRDEQVVATKVGHFRGTAAFAYEPWHIRRQCEQSLRNLRTDRIDLYYFHHGTFIGPDTDGREKDYLNEAVETMRALVREGKVRCVGLSASSEDDFARIVPVLKPDVLQAKANLRRDDFIRAGSRVQALMRAHGCTFVAFGPLDQGILLDKFDPDAPPKWEPGEYRSTRRDFSSESLLEVRRKLARVRERYHPSAGRGTSEDIQALASIAQRWVLRHDHVCGVIPGFRNESQARCNVLAAKDPPMSAEDVSWLRSVFAA